MDESTPSAGVSDPNPDSAPSPSAPASAQESQAPSIDELWDKAVAADATASEDQSTTEEAPAEDAEGKTVEEPAETEEPPAEAKPSDEGKEGKELQKTAEEKAAEREAQRPVVEPVVPARIKDAIETLEKGGYKSMASDVKNQFYALAGFREQFQTPGEARAFRELVPTLEDAKDLVKAREDRDNLDYGLNNDPVGLVHGLHETAGPQLTNLLAALPRALADLRDAQGQPDEKPFRILAATMFRSTIENLRERTTDESLLEAIEMVEAAAGVKAKAGEEDKLLKNPRVQALMRENEEHRKQGELAQQERINNFSVTVEESFRGSLGKEIDSFLAPVFKQAAFTDGAKQQILGEILGYVEEKVAPWLAGNRMQVLRSGTLDKAHADTAVKTLLGRARPFLRSNEVKGILTHWTRDILGANGREISRREQIASRRDVGSGGHAGTGAGVSTANKPIDQMTPAERAKYFEAHPTVDDIWKDGIRRAG